MREWPALVRGSVVCHARALVGQARWEREVWAKPLAGHAVAIALVNHGGRTATVVASLDAVAKAYPDALPWAAGVKLSGTEAWSGEEVEVAAQGGTLAMSLESNDTAVVVLRVKSVAAATQGGMTCATGALAAGNDVHRANMTVAAAIAYCEAQPGCAGFTSRANSTAVCRGSESVLDMRFKDSTGGNADPHWTSWTRPDFQAAYYYCAGNMCELCAPPHRACAEVTYLAEDCFGACTQPSPR